MGHGGKYPRGRKIHALKEMYLGKKKGKVTLSIILE